MGGCQGYVGAGTVRWTVPILLAGRVKHCAQSFRDTERKSRPVRKPTLILCAAIALLIAQSASAQIVKYRAFMDGPSESPPNASPGTGTSLVTFDMDLLTMHVEASFSDLIGTTTAAHIHCCTVDPGLLTAGVATVTPSFTGFPLGVTSGTMDHTFDMDSAASYNPAFVTANGGTAATARAALLSGISTGRAYFNIHTTFRTGGEIRGFLFLVPEPSTVALATLGIAGLLVRRRKR